jgi:hypothetical protein
MSSTYQSEATTSFSQAQTANEQVDKDLQPVVSAVSEHGAKYVLDHPNKAFLADAQAADGLARQYSQENAEGDHFVFEWYTSLYFGQTILAISSACFGAIAGWLLIPVVVRGRSRRRNRIARGGG